jgi:hypothetical protein
MGLYYNCCVLEPLGYELCTKMNTNALKTELLMLVYLDFLSFVASSVSLKIVLLLLVYLDFLSFIHLYYNHCVLKLLWHKQRSKINKHLLKNNSVYMSFVSFVVSFQHIKSPKIHKYILNDVIYVFIL